MNQLTNFEKKNRECLPVAKLKKLEVRFSSKNQPIFCPMYN